MGVIEVPIDHCTWTFLNSPDATQFRNPVTVGHQGGTQAEGWQQAAIPVGTYTRVRWRITIDTDGDTVDTFTVEEGLSTFDQATITWNNAPTKGGTTFWGPASGFDTLYQDYFLEFNAAGLAAVNAKAGSDFVWCIKGSNSMTDFLKYNAADIGGLNWTVLELTTADDLATYTLTRTNPADKADIDSLTYRIDASGSVGTTTLTQTGGDPVSISESPTSVYSFNDAGSGGTYQFTLDAGTDSIDISIPRLRGGPNLVFLGGDPKDIANWG